MKIFNKVAGFESKVNFVDDLNMVVGYDTYQSCCEHAGFYISNNKRTDTDDDNTLGQDVVEHYRFDPNYFEEVESTNLDSGGMVRFRLISNGRLDLYLHLFNCHNGYYGHGFNVNINNIETRKGTL